jgi:hypothetical protein
MVNYLLKQDVQEVHLMEEPVRGTFAAPTSATNTTYVCKQAQLAIAYDIGDLSVDVVGSEDPSTILPTLRQVSAMLLYQPQVPDGINFLKRGVNAVGGTPNAANTFSICFKTMFGSSTYYYKLYHCLVGSLPPPGGVGPRYAGGPAGAGFLPGATMGRGPVPMGPVSMYFTGQGPWFASAPIIGKLQGWDTTAPTNWTFVTPNTTDPLVSADAGASPLTITNADNSTQYTPVCLGASVNVFRDLALITQVGTDMYTDVRQYARRSSARYILSVEDTNLSNIYLMVHNKNHASSVLSVKSAVNAYTLTGGRLGSATVGFDAIEEVQQVITHQAQSIALA